MNTFDLGDIQVVLTRKPIKNLHLHVYPPDGHVTLSMPSGMSLEIGRAFVLSRLEWIRLQQTKIRAQTQESARQFMNGESHYLWGQRYWLRVVEEERRPTVVLDHAEIILTVRPGSDLKKRAEVVHAWHKSLLHTSVPPLIAKWEEKLRVNVNAYFLRQMKTRWGSCNPRARHIRLNTELIKKPKNLMEYVIVHELAHLLVPSHGKHFAAILDAHYPSWRKARAKLNAQSAAGEG